MKVFFPVILTILFINSAIAQYDWDMISYTHSTGSANDNSKNYYTITINNNGNSILEYYTEGKVNIREFNVSRKNLNYINSKLIKSGIFKVDPKDLSSGVQQSGDNLYTMTLTLDREFGKNYEYKFDRSNLPRKKDPPLEQKEGKKEEGTKRQVIPVPNSLKEEYKKQFYNLYYDIEIVVPNRIWNEAGEVINK